MSDATVFRQHCAAVDCDHGLVWEEQGARYRPGDPLSPFGRRLLELNGWQIRDGQWVCGRHNWPPA